METLCALFISAPHTARGTKSSTCQAVPSCSQPSLTESIYCWPASGLTFWAVLYNDDRRGSMSLLCASVANPALSQEQAHGEGSAVREEQLRACPCSLCGLLHSVAFRAPGSSVLLLPTPAVPPVFPQLAPRARRASGVFLTARRTQMEHCAPGKLATEPRGTALPWQGRCLRGFVSPGLCGKCSSAHLRGWRRCSPAPGQ